MRIATYCYTNRGSGHLRRLEQIGDALPSPELVWLGHQPPQAGQSFPSPHFASKQQGDSLNDTIEKAHRMKARSQELIAEFRRQPFDMLLTEHFPLDSLAREMEIGPLVREVKAAGVPVVGSFRDIRGEAPWPEREAVRSAGLLEKYYSAVLWHGDSSFLPFDFPLPEKLRIPVIETGYVCRPPPPAPPKEGKQLLVSVGRGLVGGTEVIEAALSCLGGLLREGWQLRILPGKEAVAPTEARVQELGVPNTTVVGWIPSMMDEVQQAAASIVTCGYNTFAEVVRCRKRAVFVPYSWKNVEEQIIRARRIAQHPGYRCVLPGEPDFPQRLLRAVQEVLDEEPQPPSLSWEGAAVSARRLLEVLQERNPSATKGNP
jgi:predicted glycosyltransferase